MYKRQIGSTFYSSSLCLLSWLKICGSEEKKRNITSSVFVVILREALSKVCWFCLLSAASRHDRGCNHGVKSKRFHHYIHGNVSVFFLRAELCLFNKIRNLCLRHLILHKMKEAIFGNGVILK